nr:hypothetical protein [Tanacetum cinerariifolium]
MNQDSYNSNSLDFDQPQPPQSLVIHQPPQELSIPEMEDLKQQYLDELQRLKEQWAYLSTHPSKRLTSFCFDDDDDEDYTSAITPDEPVLSTEEPDNSLSMGDEHLDTIPATESDEFIKSGVENLIPIPSESEGIPEYVCDVPSHDNSPPLDVSKDQIKDFSESNKEFSLIDDNLFSIDDIDYVEASPLDSELVSSEVMEIVIPKVRGIDDDILLTIEHDVLCEKLRNVNLLISKIEPLNANPTPSSDCKTKSSSTSLNSLLIEFVPCYLLSLRNKDIIFNPGICKSTSSRLDISHRCGTVKTFNTHRSHLNICPMLIHGQNTPPLDVLLFHFYPP